jgi:hypothetical protein
MSSPVAPYSPPAAGFELSSVQARLWRWQGPSALAGESAAELVLALPADADEVRLRASLAALCARHEVLRTRYVSLPELRLPLQVIEPEPSIAWNTPERGSAQVWVRCARSEQGLRLRLQLAALALDAQSLARLAAEWAAAYSAEVRSARTTAIRGLLRLAP